MPERGQQAEQTHDQNQDQRQDQRQDRDQQVKTNTAGNGSGTTTRSGGGSPGMLGARGGTPLEGVPQTTGPIGAPTVPGGGTGAHTAAGTDVDPQAMSTASTPSSLDNYGTVGGISSHTTASTEVGTHGIPGTPVPGPMSHDITPPQMPNGARSGARGAASIEAGAGSGVATGGTPAAYAGEEAGLSGFAHDTSTPVTGPAAANPDGTATPLAADESHVVRDDTIVTPEVTDKGLDERGRDEPDVPGWGRGGSPAYGGARSGQGQNTGDAGVTGELRAYSRAPSDQPTTPTSDQGQRAEQDAADGTHGTHGTRAFEAGPGPTENWSDRGDNSTLGKGRPDAHEAREAGQIAEADRSGRGVPLSGSLREPTPEVGVAGATGPAEGGTANSAGVTGAQPGYPHYDTATGLPAGSGSGGSRPHIDPQFDEEGAPHE